MLVTGQRFGRWTVALSTFEVRGRSAHWLVRCDCGTEAWVAGIHLRKAKSTSCRSCGQVTHGHAKGYRHTRTYNSWSAMHMRCNDPKHAGYPWYGAIGVKICARWNTFANFLADMGERPAGKTLDRINPYGLEYGPGLCRWARPREQALNQRRFHSQDNQVTQ
jgi:hypothetical protein